MLLAADAVGGAQHCVELSVAYAKQREQFGRPIGSFQALKHQLANLALDAEPTLENARGSVERGGHDMNEREKLNRAVSEARDFNPYAGEFLEREFEVYRRLREHLPIARSEAMGNSSEPGAVSDGWVLTRYEDGCEVLSDPAILEPALGLPC